MRRKDRVWRAPRPGRREQSGSSAGCPSPMHAHSRPCSRSPARCSAPQTPAHGTQRVSSKAAGDFSRAGLKPCEALAHRTLYCMQDMLLTRTHTCKQNPLRHDVGHWSGEVRTRSVTSAVWPLSLKRPVSPMTSHRMMSVSCEPDASMPPLLLYRSAVTALLCPVHVTCQSNPELRHGRWKTSLRTPVKGARRLPSIADHD